MVSIIKNQLLKHLSRFTKNLSADKINLSTFKGEGELSNLELDEIVLTDLLELPSWLQLTSAYCNKVSFRIPWTKLKTVPMYMSLDEVAITVETCEELRSLSSQAGLSSYTGAPGKYSFIHKVIDGITVTVNRVIITFNSPAFTANIQISRILVESKSPFWTRCDLKGTRLKESDKGLLLIFKELEWQTLRVEAKSTVDKDLTPLRLITNQAKCRITIKKRLSDCFIMGSRLVIILDDLLWALTDSQLKAALHFLDSLADLVQKATEVTRSVKAARKIEEHPEYLEQQAKDKSSNISKIFSSYDVIETSYHFLSHQIILHLSDDPGPGRSVHSNLVNGGALQICLQEFQVDFYPYHVASADRRHWPRYRDSTTPHVRWQEQALQAFRTKFLDLLDRGGGSGCGSAGGSGQHTPLSRSTNKGVKAESDQMTSPTNEPRVKAENKAKKFAQEQFRKMMTMSVIMRIHNFTLYKLTTPGKKLDLKEFIAGDRQIMSLPDDTNIVHAEFIYFYYANDIPFPIPPPKFYVQLNPIQVNFDLDSCLWLNSFALNLHQSLISSKLQQLKAKSTAFTTNRNSNVNVAANNLTYIDVKIEAILPRLTFESILEYPTQKDRPRALTFQTTRVTITNVRSLEQSSRADLAKCVDSFHMGSLFFGSEFPSESGDFYIVTQKLLDHISAVDNVRQLPSQLDSSSIEALLSQINREFLWTEAKDVWCISLDPVWSEFTGARTSHKPVPFLDAVPVTIWAHAYMDPNSTAPRGASPPAHNAHLHALLHIGHLVSLQLNHYQYLFLLRLAEQAGELALYLQIDSNRIMKAESNTSMAIGALIPQLELTFVMPSQNPGKESSGADMESFVPESSSIADDILVAGSNATIWHNSDPFIPHGYPESSKKVFVANGEPPPINEMSSSYSLDFTAESKMLAHKNLQEPIYCEAQSAFLPRHLNSATKQPPAAKPLPGITSMKKGFSSLLTSIDTAFKQQSPNADDFSDTLSIRSDGSSESGNYILVNMDQQHLQQGATSAEGGPQQRPNPLDHTFNVPDFRSEGKIAVEIATEVAEEASPVESTESERSLTSSCKRKDLVSISTFKLNKLEFLQQSVGYASSIKVQVGNIATEDCNSIPWDEFQSKFSSRSRAWTDTIATPAQSTGGGGNGVLSNNANSRVLLRFDHKPSGEIGPPYPRNLDEFTALFNDLLDIRVCDLQLTLPMSVVIGLADLAEDEIVGPAVPLLLYVRRLALTLNEDRPPVNITSPGSIPIKMNVAELRVVRDASGVFKLEQTTSGSGGDTVSEGLTQQQCRQLRAANDELQRRLVAFERISEENRQLRRAADEMELLRGHANAALDKVNRLLNERSEYLAEIRRLQDQLAASGKGGAYTSSSSGGGLLNRQQWTGGGLSKR